MEEKAELERRIAQAREYDVDTEAVKRFCQLASQNISNFTYEDKCLTMEALQIRVWIDGEDAVVEGAIPISQEPQGRCIVSTISG